MTDWPIKISDSITGWNIEIFTKLCSEASNPEAKFILGIQSSSGHNATFYLGRDVSDFDKIITKADRNYQFKVIDLRDDINKQFFSRAVIPVSDYQPSNEIHRG